MNDWVRETYETHRRLLFRVAWLVLRRSDLAEDAVHAAFSRILRNRPNINGDAKAYVVRAVRNAAIDLQRRAANQRTENSNNLDQLPGNERPSRNGQIRSDAVIDALERLETDTQEIIHLHIHERMTFREIGDLLDLPLQTVASRYRRGLKKIEQTVRGDEGLEQMSFSKQETASTGPRAAYALQSGHEDPRLRAIIDAWPMWPPSVVADILVLAGIGIANADTSPNFK